MNTLFWSIIFALGFQNSLVATPKHSAGYLSDNQISVKQPADVRGDQFEPSIRYNGESVEVNGLDPGIVTRAEGPSKDPNFWKEIFPVYTGESAPKAREKRSILGTYGLEDGVLKFNPRYSFVEGMTYTARLDLAGLFQVLESTSASSDLVVVHTFTIPKPESTPTTIVTEVYPTGDLLPENLLKFYIHFSAPMQRNQVYPFIHLIDDTGTAIEAAFLELEPELWDPETRRLTIFFDPGRIKRGLLPNDDLGLAIRKDRSYRLVIDREIADAQGNPLTEPFSKAFRVGTDDRTSPDHTKWRLTAPESHSQVPILLDFSEPLDQALLMNMIEIRSKNGDTIYGEAIVANGEKQWQFKPNTPWESGQYEIHVNASLEDRAGNKLNRLFDRDMEKTDRSVEELEKSFTIEFEIQ